MNPLERAILAGFAAVVLTLALVAVIVHAHHTLRFYP